MIGLGEEMRRLNSDKGSMLPNKLSTYIHYSICCRRMQKTYGLTDAYGTVHVLAYGMQMQHLQHAHQAS